MSQHGTAQTSILTILPIDMKIAEILNLGFPLVVELLTDLPDTSDALTWPRIVLADPPVLTATPLVLQQSPFLLATFNFTFIPTLDAPATVRAFGVRYNGGCVLVGQCSPFYLSSGFPCNFKASVAVYPWAS